MSLPPGFTQNNLAASQSTTTPSIQQPYSGPFEPDFTVPPEPTQLFTVSQTENYTNNISFSILQQLPVSVPGLSTPNYSISGYAQTIFQNYAGQYCLPVWPYWCVNTGYYYSVAVGSQWVSGISIPPINIFSGFTFQIGGNVNINIFTQDDIELSLILDILTRSVTDPSVVVDVESLNIIASASDITLYINDSNGNPITSIPINLGSEYQTETFTLGQPTNIGTGNQSISLVGNSQTVSFNFNFTNSGISSFATSVTEAQPGGGYFDNAATSNALGNFLQSGFYYNIPTIPQDNLSFAFNFTMTPTLLINLDTIISQLAAQPPPTVTVDLSSSISIDVNVSIDFNAPSPVGGYNYTTSQTVVSPLYATTYTQSP
jgi:hypothetical protein